MKRCMNCMHEYEEHNLACPACGYMPESAERLRTYYPDALVPETILGGRFIIGCMRSYGEFENVYTSWDALLERRVIVREYFPNGTGSRRDDLQVEVYNDDGKNHFQLGKEAFLAEGRYLSRCQDIKGIVNIYRVLEEYGTAYQICEYMDMITLEQALEQRASLSAEDAMGLMQRLCEVVDECHQRKIIHCNLSPENIFVDNDLAPMLFDFGGAKMEVQRMLGSDVAIFDPFYTAPEVLSGRDYGPGADVFSLGAIMNRLFSGKSFGGPAVRITKNEQARIRKILSRAMAHDPGKRPGTVREFMKLMWA